MKHPLKTISLLTASALLSLSSLTAVETDPVGYVTETLPAGSSLVGSPLQGETAFQGTAGSLTGNVLSLSAVPDLAGPHFLLVASGAASGSFSTVSASDGSSVTLESTANLAGLSSGDSVKIIEHFTLSDLTQASGSTVPDSSTVTVYNSDGSSTTYTSFSGTWFDSDFVDSDSAIIFPGEGVALSLQSETTFTFVGAVNTNEITIPVTSGVVNIVGSENPSAPTGENSGNSIGDALSSLPDSSTVTIYSNDGQLSIQETFTLFGGSWFDADFSEVEISVAAPATIVVSPQGSGQVTLPAAYSLN